MRATDGMRIHGARIAVELARGRVRERDDNSCFRCGRDGHWARDCREKNNVRRSSPRYR
jgi:hypothetical protein